ncbi:multicopper oxidase domain-containing protein [Nocardioides marinquilinus]|uniref:Multicopper oxidase domain-containing protein n=1 Tax=Nocardioides marinquilinus TaxID=1210400 RepID=A0ABP9PIM8_9ACTN
MTPTRRAVLRGLGAGPVAALGAGAVGIEAASAADVPASFPAPSRRIQLYAVELPDYSNEKRIGYGRTPESASIPGPTIEMLEGECIEIVLHNEVSAETLEALRTDEHTPLGVSLHAHGVRYDQASDGTVHSDSWVAPGESRTYVWYARPANRAKGIVGTAGYWWYHDHVVGTQHGTAGLAAGLFGALIVRRRSDPLPAHTYVTAFGDAMELNARRYPDTDTYDPADPVRSNTSLVANQGERIEFVNIALGSELHTWHLHGHTWADNRTGVLADVPWADDVAVIDNKTIGPGDSFGFQVIAGDMSGPGHWMLHCHLQTHSDMGMVTFFHVHDRQGRPPAGEWPPPHAGHGM